MTEDKSEAIQKMVDSTGKTSDRIRAANTTFSTFASYAERAGIIDPSSGTEAELPKVIAGWLGLIAGVGSSQNDDNYLSAVGLDSVR